MPDAHYRLTLGENLKCAKCWSWLIFGDDAILTLKPLAFSSVVPTSYEVTDVKCESCAKKAKEEKLGNQ